MILVPVGNPGLQAPSSEYHRSFLSFLCLGLRISRFRLKGVGLRVAGVRDYRFGFRRWVCHGTADFRQTLKTLSQILSPLGSTWRKSMDIQSPLTDCFESFLGLLVSSAPLL